MTNKPNSLEQLANFMASICPATDKDRERVGSYDICSSVPQATTEYTRQINKNMLSGASKTKNKGDRKRRKKLNNIGRPYTVTHEENGREYKHSGTWRKTGDQNTFEIARPMGNVKHEVDAIYRNVEPASDGKLTLPKGVKNGKHVKTVAISE